ncbi:MAG: septum formation protein Maf [Nitrospinae bacterium CG11_big_fil_rev_8_21_14_0_20_56_8]|nr:MAG: septum formation protein Maf [Nitrospinae bacterium CG11_big_fil_rev_8_21_14_0_20_56_8]
MTSHRKKIILASQSPRRVELLKRIAPEFLVIPSEVDEVFDPDRDAEENAMALAREKALWVVERHPGHIVIGADTIVVLDREIIGKPADAHDAERILTRLSGREHRVITAVAVVNAEITVEATVSHVRIKPLTRGEISAYVASGEPLDKAGAYAIQGAGFSIVASHRGSYSNIVGLPLPTVRKLLLRTGYECLPEEPGD